MIRLPLAFLLASGAGQAASARFSSGLDLYKAGKCGDALAAFHASEIAGEDAPERDYYEGVCRARQEQWPRAEQSLLRYAAAYPAHAQAWYWLSQAQLYQKHFTDAKLSIGKALEREPRSADFHRTLGEIELELANHDAAYRAWLKANELNPRDARTTYYLGRLFYEADFFEEAASWLRTTLKLAPDHYAAMNYLGLCAERLNLEDPALKLYRASIQHSKEQGKPYSWAYVNLADLLRRQGGNAEARSVLEESEKLCPEAHALAALGRLLAASDDPARAEQVLKRAVALDASIPDAHYRLSLLLRSGGHAEEAARELALFQETKAEEDRRRSRIMAIRK